MTAEQALQRLLELAYDEAGSDEEVKADCDEAKAVLERELGRNRASKEERR